MKDNKERKDRDWGGGVTGFCFVWEGRVMSLTDKYKGRATKFFEKKKIKNPSALPPIKNVPSLNT